MSQLHDPFGLQPSSPMTWTNHFNYITCLLKSCQWFPSAAWCLSPSISGYNFLLFLLLLNTSQLNRSQKLLYILTFALLFIYSLLQESLLISAPYSPKTLSPWMKLYWLVQLFLLLWPFLLNHLFNVCTYHLSVILQAT